MVERIVGGVVEFGHVLPVGGQADAVRVSVGELHRVRVARRNDDAAEVHERDVQREQGGLLAAVHRLRRRERRVDLVRQLALRPEPTQRVDEGAELRCDRTESRRRPEDHRVRPHDVIAGGGGQVLGGLVVGRPRGILGERRRITGLGDVPHPHLGACGLGRRRDAAGHRGAVPGGGVVDDREFRHGSSQSRRGVRARVTEAS